MATFKITLIKSTPYRAEAEEEWSNTYHFSGTEPGNATEWEAFGLAVWAVEGMFLYAVGGKSHLTRLYGYSPGSDAAVYVGDLTAGGTSPGVVPAGGGMNHTGPVPQDLSVCALLKFQCGLSAKTGKPRYIMKYLHDQGTGTGTGDATGGASGAGVAALGTMYDASLPGGAVLCAPDGTHATSGVLAPYYTTHQIKRRGKRPRRGA